MNAAKKHSYRDYLLESLADPQEADAYFEALCEPDVPISQFIESANFFTNVYGNGDPVRAFATLYYPRLLSWYWVVLQPRGLCRGGYYKAKSNEVIYTDCGFFDSGDWKIPKEERVIKFLPKNARGDRLFAPAPDELMPEFEKILTKRFYLKYPF
jgi:hypothetical protein